MRAATRRTEKKRWRTALTALAAALCLTSAPAFAQVLREVLPANEPPGGLRDLPQRQQGQFNRLHPGYEQEGIKAGAFTVKPKVTTGVKISDNIYAKPAEKAKGDVIGVVEPDLRLLSNWSRHELVVRGSGEFARHMNEDGENVNNYDFTVGGRIDLDRETALELSGKHRKYFEQRGDPDSVDTLKPTSYRETAFGGGLRHGAGPWSIGLNGKVANLSFDDTPLQSGGVMPASLRNRDLYTVSLRTGYEVGGGSVLFVEARNQIGAYDKERTASTYDRDWRAFTMGGGLAYDFGVRVSGELFAGAQTRNVDDTRLNDVSTYVYSAHILFNATELTSFRAMAYRTFTEVQTGPTPGFYNTTFWGGVEHELQRNVILNANLSRRMVDYEQVDNRIKQWSVGAGATWLLNPNLRAQAEYNHTLSDNSLPNADFVRNQGTLRLTAQF